MLKWHKDFYIGPGIQKLSRIRHRLSQGKPVPGIYLITLSDNPRKLLEILPALTLIQESAAQLCPEIVGVAKGKDEAMELVTEMIQSIYSETGGFEVKEYWKNR